MLIKAKPTKMSVYTANGKMTCAQVRKKTGCDICFNGTLYNMKNYNVVCDIKLDGEVLCDSKYTYRGYAWNTGDARAVNVVSTEMDKWDNFISCVFLAKDGEALPLYYDAGVAGKRGRTAFGYNKDGEIVIFCSKDGTADACTPEVLRKKMLSFGCVDAIMLDGGGSVQIDSDFGVMTSARKVANFICVWIEKEEKEKEDINTKLECPYKEPTTNIKNGSRGEGAKWTQWMLNEANNAGLVVDGIIGAKSVAAIKAFQKKSGLTVDGISGKLTRTALKEATKE